MPRRQIFSPMGMYTRNSADSGTINPLFDLDQSRMEPELKSDKHFQTVSLDQIPQCINPVQRMRNWLFQEQMTSGFCGLESDIHVH
jgi:hypothetical protein